MTPEQVAKVIEASRRKRLKMAARALRRWIERREQIKLLHARIGVDLARPGEDMSAVCALEGNRVVAIIVLP